MVCDVMQHTATHNTSGSDMCVSVMMCESEDGMRCDATHCNTQHIRQGLLCV